MLSLHKKTMLFILIMEVFSIIVSQLTVIPSWETIQGLFILIMQWSVWVASVMLLIAYRKQNYTYHSTSSRWYIKPSFLSLLVALIYYYSIAFFAMATGQWFMWPEFSREYYNEQWQHIYEFSDCRMDACYSTITYRRLWSTPLLLFVSENKDITTY